MTRVAQGQHPSAVHLGELNGHVDGRRPVGDTVGLGRVGSEGELGKVIEPIPVGITISVLSEDTTEVHVLPEIMDTVVVAIQRKWVARIDDQANRHHLGLRDGKG